MSVSLHRQKVSPWIVPRAKTGPNAARARDNEGDRLLGDGRLAWLGLLLMVMSGLVASRLIWLGLAAVIHHGL